LDAGAESEMPGAAFGMDGTIGLVRDRRAGGDAMERSWREAELAAIPPPGSIRASAGDLK